METTRYQPLLKPSQLPKRRGPSDASVLDRVRIKCRQRDDPCAIHRIAEPELSQLIAVFGRCHGGATLAHLFGHRRSKTRGMSPTARHHSHFCLRLCLLHHNAEEHRGLRFVGLTDSGMDGQISWTYTKPKPTVERA